jgi:hypothetical protein
MAPPIFLFYVVEAMYAYKSNHFFTDRRFYKVFFIKTRDYKKKFCHSSPYVYPPPPPPNEK